MAGMGDAGDMEEALRSLAEQAREVWDRFSEEIDLDRRMREKPMAVLGTAALAGFILGGGLWPVVRPFVRTAVRTALSPPNLLAIGAAVGAFRAARPQGEPAPAQVSGTETH